MKHNIVKLKDKFYKLIIVEFFKCKICRNLSNCQIKVLIGKYRNSFLKKLPHQFYEYKFEL